MSFGMWNASVPVFVNSLANMREWLDKVAQEKDPAALMEAQLAPDMRPLPAQYQMASDSAKNALARLTGTEAPSMPDTETSFAELRDRCDRTIDYVKGFDARSLEGSADREVVIKFPTGRAIVSAVLSILPALPFPTSFFTTQPPTRFAQCGRIARQAGLPAAPRSTQSCRLKRATIGSGLERCEARPWSGAELTYCGGPVLDP